MITQGHPHRHVRTIALILVVTLAALMGTFASAQEASASASPRCTGDEHTRYEVCWTAGGSYNPLIAQRIKTEIYRARVAFKPGSGDYIRGAMYLWEADSSGTRVIDELGRAARAGISVRLVLARSGTLEVVPLINEINRENATIKGSRQIDVELCTKSCVEPSAGAMHNKFFVIKSAGKKIVLQTSTNLTESQETYAGNLLITQDDDELFSHYVNYWRRLNANSWTWEGDTWGVADRARAGSNDLSRVYFSPRPSGDVLAGVLGNVTKCRDGDDRVWVSASRFDGKDDVHQPINRPEVVRELRRLTLLGCDVRVAVRSGTDRARLRDALPPQAQVVAYHKNHSKFVVLDAYYAGEWRKAVFVGSYNINANSHRNADDTMLRVINGWVANRYIEHFERIDVDTAP